MLSTPNVRRHASAPTGDPAVFVASLESIPWLAHLGEPSPWDAGAVRLGHWDDWPGPEDAPGVTPLALDGQAWLDALRAADPGDFQTFFEAVRDRVLHLGFQVPGTDPTGDAWEPRTASVWGAAWAAALVASFLRQGWAIPEDLRETWAWFESGHWAAGYESDPQAGPQRLLVL